jgi:hypothetical protein
LKINSQDFRVRPGKKVELDQWPTAVEDFFKSKEQYQKLLEKHAEGLEFTATTSAEELKHDFLWRTTCRLPERGRIGIFNRSYYEEVLITRVHPEILDTQNLPKHSRDGHLVARCRRSISYEWILRSRPTTDLRSHFRQGIKLAQLGIRTRIANPV